MRPSFLRPSTRMKSVERRMIVSRSMYLSLSSMRFLLERAVRVMAPTTAV